MDNMKNICNLIYSLVFITAISLLTPAIASASSNTVEVFNGVNQIRITNHVKPLTYNKDLQRSAQAKADDLCNNDYFEHGDAQGRHLGYWIGQAGYNYEFAAENLAKGYNTLQEAISGWQNSPKHLAAIMDQTYTDTGIGVTMCASYQGKANQTIIVQHFAKPEVIQQPVVETHQTDWFLLLQISAVSIALIGGGLYLRTVRRK